MAFSSFHREPHNIWTEKLHDRVRKSTIEATDLKSHLVNAKHAGWQVGYLDDVSPCSTVMELHH